jgi:formate dehydrogenase subunit delta
MDSRKLVKMANEIAAFFETDPDPAVRTAGISGHIGRFWEPRMRRALFQHLDQEAGAGLKASVIEALQSHRDSLQPKA